MRRTAITAVLTGICTATLGVVPPPPAAGSGPAQPVSAAAHTLEWGRCGDRMLRQFKAKCAMLRVPLDHADPGGPTIRVAVSRILHTKEPYRGAVLTNPGGPGGSGLSMAVAGQFVPDGVGKTYDWYGIDPRGVGASRPALTCDNQYFGWNRPAYKPATAEIMRSWRRKTAGYAKDCGRAGASRLLEHMRTTDLVADYEALREAIGAEQITFVGVSYGTYLAQVYATLHPDRIQAMILDAVVNPKRVFYRAFRDQARGLGKTLNRFFAWVASHPGVLHLGRSKGAVDRAYQRLHRDLARHPANGRVGPDELDDALEPAVFGSASWPDVAKALSALANKGRAEGIERLYRDGYPVGRGADNYHAAGLATVCTDAKWPKKWSTWRRNAWRLNRTAPFYTWSNTWWTAPCLTWPAPASRRVAVSGDGFTAPILMLNETQDGATPYGGALAARKIWPSAALVAGVGGTTHAAGLSGIACTDNAIAALLRDGSLPARKSGNRADKKCNPVPPPSSDRFAP